MEMTDIFNTWLAVIVEFLFELYVFYALFTRKLEKKNNFIFRVIFGFVIVLVISFPISIMYHYFGDKVIGCICTYILLFTISLLHAKICFKESFLTIIMTCVMAYAAQNAIYKMFLSLWVAGLYYNLFGSLITNFTSFYQIIYHLFFVICVVLFYFFFIKKLSQRISKKQPNYQLLMISVLILVITIIICSIEDIHFRFLSSNNDNQFDNYNYFVLRETGNFLSILCCLIVLFLISKTINEDNLKQEVQYLQHAIKQSENQYVISKDTIKMINIKCHDIKYKLKSIVKNGCEDDIINDIEKNIAIYDCRIETGNKLLDVLFTEKSLYCEKQEIKISCMIDGAKLNFIEDGDLYCLFGNIIDNALEAVSNIQDKEKRIINIVVKTRGNLLIVQTENYFDGAIAYGDDGLPLTKKGDKDYHGFGMQSIRLIVEKYDGTMTAFNNGNIFHLNILFNLETNTNSQFE